ncbi:MAG: YggT family protein [Longimicrobiaceae bacterium]
MCIPRTGCESVHFRSILPRTEIFDLSPMVALFAIYFLQSLIAGAMSG